MAEHKASCQCGAFQVFAAADPDMVIACNCRACQKRSGSPFGAAGYFKKSAIKVTGENQIWARNADSGRGLENHFCPVCGTNLYWSLEMRPNHIGIALGCFEASLPEPERAIWMEAKHDWVQFPDHWPTFGKGTPE